ncbi:MAG TPA: isoprenylcysteine carboxylmethyltransferase family protein [Mucilaginibacter sp.]|jgi:methyltransferase|nr:isoprenylcysteine carboxylmethyltransferase family protein [Mucilaginibacter sp.]
MYFIIFIIFLITQRLTELYISKRNEKWLLANGAIEYGREHYPYIVAMHTLFILSLIAEYYLIGGRLISYLFLGLFILLLLFKYWVLSSLGTYWNTRIYRVPGSSPVKKGPYKLFKHPNYVDVVCEIAIIPLVFHLYYTAVIFSVLNAIMLTIRIKVENKVWAD